VWLVAEGFAARGVGVWYALPPVDAVSGERSLHGIVGATHPDAARVECVADVLERLPEGDRLLWSVRGRASVASIEVFDVGASGPPPWFVLNGAQGPSDRVVLIAFQGGRTSATAVIDEVGAAALGVGGGEQVGAVEWEPRSGIVRQLFVRPDRRRERLGTVLVSAASAVQQFYGWPGVVRADGGRTEMGQQFLSALPFQARVPRWTRRALPMDRDTR
jgi:GNAT superfamily N-acetyltransferase